MYITEYSQYGLLHMSEACESSLIITASDNILFVAVLFYESVKQWATGGPFNKGQSLVSQKPEDFRVQSIIRLTRSTGADMNNIPGQTICYD